MQQFALMSFEAVWLLTVYLVAALAASAAAAFLQAGARVAVCLSNLYGCGAAVSSSLPSEQLRFEF